MTTFTTKRIYESPEKDDGYRVLVDRLWPRGVAKADAALDDWAKDIAPSTELRKWFGHEPEKFDEFVKRYRKELRENDHSKSMIDTWSDHEKVTLLYGAKDETHNEAVVLKKWLQDSKR